MKEFILHGVFPELLCLCNVSFLTGFVGVLSSVVSSEVSVLVICLYSISIVSLACLYWLGVGVCRSEGRHSKQSSIVLCILRCK